MIKEFPEMNNKNSEVCEKSQSQSHVKVGFTEALHTAMAQIDLQEFDRADRALAYELIMIIAEMYSLYPLAPVKINSERLTAETVGEVYSRLTSDHLKFCIGKFREVKYEIKYRKSYFRTALYNSAFETESYYENAVRKDGLI